MVTGAFPGSSTTSRIVNARCNCVSNCASTPATSTPCACRLFTSSVSSAIPGGQLAPRSIRPVDRVLRGEERPFPGDVRRTSIGPWSPLSSCRIAGTSSTLRERLAHREARPSRRRCAPTDPRSSPRSGSRRGVPDSSSVPPPTSAACTASASTVASSCDVTRAVVTHLHRDRGVDRAHAAARTRARRAKAKANGACRGCCEPGGSGVPLSPRTRCPAISTGGRLDALDRAEHEVLTLGVDQDGLTGVELLPQDLLGQRVLEVALDRAPQRTSTELRVVALLGQQELGFRGELEARGPGSPAVLAPA